MRKRTLFVASMTSLSFIVSSASAVHADEADGAGSRGGNGAYEVESATSRSERDPGSTDASAEPDGQGQQKAVDLETIEGQAAVTAGDDDSRMLLEVTDPDLASENGVGLVSSQDAPSTSFAIASTPEGSVRVHSVLEDEQAPERLSYSFPEADFIDIDEADGIAYLVAYNENETEANIVGVVDAPWAVDSQGAEVPTHFEADGNTLTQVVEHRQGDYAYPITADPDWWDNVKSWFSSASDFVKSKAKSAASWLKSKAGWLKGKTWQGVKWIRKSGGKAVKFFAKKVGPGAAVLCLSGGAWRWYRSDAKGWVRVGDAVTGCIG